jgi:hypothetical protein
MQQSRREGESINGFTIFVIMKRQFDQRPFVRHDKPQGRSGTHGRTPLTCRRAPTAQTIKRAPAAHCQNCQTPSCPADRRPTSERRWTPCEKQDRGGFGVDRGVAHQKTREGAQSCTATWSVDRKGSVSRL